MVEFNLRNKSLFVHILFLSFLVLVFGGIFYHYVKNLSWLDAFYFAAITLTTVGYGDIYPVTHLGRIFTIFYVLVGIGIVFSLINEITRVRLKKHIMKVERKEEKIEELKDEVEEKSERLSKKRKELRKNKK